MAQCDECGCYDDNHAEILDYPAGMEDDDEKQQEWLEEQEDYEPHRYYYWHADIQEDYQMPKGYECLCEECFGNFLNKGQIIEKYMTRRSLEVDSDRRASQPYVPRIDLFALFG